MNSVSAMLYPPKPDGAPTGKGEKEKPLLLVVEDNPDNMITVKALLSENYRVVGAGDGEEGIELAKKTYARPDTDGY